MRRAYWFLLLFGLWCIGCGIWYMFAVKGISTDPRFFNPHVRWMAILEILVMVLIACLIGFAIGWALRDGPLSSWQEAVEQLESEKQTLLLRQQQEEEELQKLQGELIQVQQTYAVKLNKSRQDTASLTKELADVNLELSRVASLGSAPIQVQQLENEAGALRFRAKQLEFQIHELEENNQKLSVALEECHAGQLRKAAAEPMHPFVRPVEMNEKDDLTLIKGIGPFIEKRLNMVGIYTFRQISEFTPEMIEHVTKAIEFFPNRILRDDWVGQATRLV
jgi:predicted flap endonuclease-1-like 5' DNA nuclease